MSTREQLNLYLRGLESRLRWLVVSRGVAAAFGVALGATVALVLITNAFAFSATSMMVARVALYVSLAVAVGLGLVIPLLKLNQRRAAGRAEAAHPAFEQRLMTYIDRQDAQDPMLELLAEDTLLRAPEAPPSKVIPQKSIFAFGTSAGAALAVLMWLILAEGGFMHFGARTLWAGLPKGDQPGYYQIVVEPGDATIRRRTDQSIVATLQGFNAPEVRLMVKYQSSAKWEEAIMIPRPGESSYGFLIAAVPEEFQYYVEAAGVKSKAYRIQVVDLPGIKNIKVTYHFPSWMGQKDLVEDPGGDLRAVVGTVAELTVETDRPLTNGVVMLQDGRQIEMRSLGGNLLSVRVPVDKEGVYHFAARNGEEVIRLSQDYFIEAQADEGPKVSIRHPGPDARVNPVEEVIVQVQADDDYGLTALDLHYSVNGQPEKVVNLLGGQRGRLAAEGTFTLYLEDFHLVPGDVVAMYATAKDARTESASDINFIEAQPYEKNYSQAQSAGGGGGGGGGAQQEQNEISRRQREIITLTHRALRGNPDERSAATRERAEFLAEVQNKLKDQATSLANRIKARELDGESSTIGEFVKEIEAAAAEMGPAAAALGASKWEEALIPEQKALQHLQRAEQMNRDIQVAFGNQGGGGGGGGGNAGRDLANLFDLELDTEKNQYEQAQQAQGGGAEQQQQQVDEALRKLQELARRQEQLAQQNRNSKQLSVDRRWEQEQLRREVEQLRRQLEQMQAQGQQGQQQQRGQAQLSRSGSQGGQQGQQGQQQGQAGQQGQQGQQGKQGQQSAQNAQQRQIQQLLDRLNQAQQDMREAQRASQTGDQSQADAAARRAAERLQEAQQAGNQLQRQGLTAGLESLEQRAQALAERQERMENQLKQAYPRGTALTGKQSGPGLSQQERQEMAAEKDQMRQELAQLERDAQRQARDLSNQQPEASRRLREGLSEVQQAEAQRRLEYGAEYIRRGTPSQIADWTSREGPLTQSLRELRDAIRDARGALREGDQRNAAQSDLERQVANLERTRAQLERALAQQQARQQGQPGQNGKQGGQQQGQQGGNQQGGNQQGGNQQGGGDQFGGDRAGGYTNGGYYGGPYGGYDRFGRYNPEGLYDPRNPVPVDPRQVLRDAQRDLQALRNAVRDNRDLAAQAAALERQVQDLTLGNPSGPELQERLSRTILPQLETLEVGLRQELEKTEGQVRSASADRTPVGFAEAVSEYFRKLSRSK